MLCNGGTSEGWTGLCHSCVCLSPLRLPWAHVRRVLVYEAGVCGWRLEERVKPYRAYDQVRLRTRCGVRTAGVCAFRSKTSASACSAALIRAAAGGQEPKRRVSLLCALMRAAREAAGRVASLFFAPNRRRRARCHPTPSPLRWSTPTRRRGCRWERNGKWGEYKEEEVKDRPFTVFLVVVFTSLRPWTPFRQELHALGLPLRQGHRPNRFALNDPPSATASAAASAATAYGGSIMAEAAATAGASAGQVGGGFVGLSTGGAGLLSGAAAEGSRDRWTSLGVGRPGRGRYLR